MGQFDNIGAAPQAGLHDEEIQQTFPNVIYMGQKTPEEYPGYFAIEQGNIDEMPDGWSEHTLEWDSGPVPVYVTRSLMHVAIAVRKRWTVEDANGKFVAAAPWKGGYKEALEIGQQIGVRPKGHVQALIRLPDSVDTLKLTLKGYYKSMSWTHDPSFSKKDNGFPDGVEYVVRQYTQEANAYLRAQGYGGEPYPWKGMWWVHLVPWMEQVKKGKAKAKLEPVFLHLGRQQYANPFVALTETTKALPSRYIGDELFEELQTFYAETGKEWEAQWDDGAAADEEKDAAAVTAHEWGGAVDEEIENDPIPF